MNEPSGLTLLQRREIEARLLGPVFRAFAAEIGEERARTILARTIKELACQSGQAARAAAGGNELAHLQQVVENWRAGGALSLDIVRRDEEVFEFNVVSCQFAEMYRRLGLADLGPILSCNRDGSMIEGFNPKVEFSRTQTLMEGAEFCDFRYRLKKPSDGP